PPTDPKKRPARQNSVQSAAPSRMLTLISLPPRKGHAVGKKDRKKEAEQDIVDHESNGKKLKRKKYDKKLAELHMELVKMQYWIKATGKKVVLVFEGRDAAGKGGAIKCLSAPLNPRGCRVVA